MQGVLQPGAIFSQAGERFFGPPQLGLQGGDLGEGFHEVIADRTVVQQLGCLFVEPHATAAGAHHGTAVGVFGAGDDAQQRGLAAAIAAHQHGVVGGLQDERDVGEQAAFTERLLYVVE